MGSSPAPTPRRQAGESLLAVLRADNARLARQVRGLRGVVAGLEEGLAAARARCEQLQRNNAQLRGREIQDRASRRSRAFPTTVTAVAEAGVLVRRSSGSPRRLAGGAGITLTGQR